MLRPYQIAQVVELRRNIQAGLNSQLAVAPTGSGKTVLSAHMLKESSAAGYSSVFMVHRIELIEQSIRAFKSHGVTFGVCANGFVGETKFPVQIASVQTLVRRLSLYKQPDMLVVDEAHHQLAKSYGLIRQVWSKAHLIGLTATPERLDGKGLGSAFQRLVLGPTVASLIRDGYLSKYRLFAPGGVSVDGVKVVAGDYARGQLSKAADKPTITGDAIAHYTRLCLGKRAVVFAVSIEHSKHIAAQFNAAGIPAAHVDGETPVEERRGAVSEFIAGRVMVLVNVDLFGEGFDVPAIEAVIMLRPTQSLSLYLQMCGRALRPMPGKDTAIILDHAGNVQRHGFPDDEREWSLEGRVRSKPSVGGSVASVRVCPRCFAAQPPTGICRFCGQLFPVAPREIEEAAGELVEVKPVRVKRTPDETRALKNEQGSARTLDDLIALAKSRGYKSPVFWARKILTARGGHGR